MKLTTLKLSALAIVAGITLTAGSAQAQTLGQSMILTFQNPFGTVGADQTIHVNLGRSTTFFRDAAPGSITNISVAGLGTALSNTYGTNWFNLNTLYMGAIGFRGAGSIELNTLFDGDPQQTQYFTKQRGEFGNPLVAASQQPFIPFGGAGTTVTNGMGQVRNELSGQPNILVQQASNSFIPANNTFTAPGVQQLGYGAIAGGVQGNFGEGSFGSFGSIGNIELLLDLYRVQYRNDIAGQARLGQPINTGEFLGTIALTSTGELFFIAVPEPSTVALIALGLVVAAFVIIRRRKSASA